MIFVVNGRFAKTRRNIEHARAFFAQGAWAPKIAPAKSKPPIERARRLATLLSCVQAAKALGVTRQQLHNVIAGRSAVTPEMAVKLEVAIGGAADAWLRMQRKRDIKGKRLASAQGCHKTANR